MFVNVYLFIYFLAARRGSPERLMFLRSTFWATVCKTVRPMLSGSLSITCIIDTTVSMYCIHVCSVCL